MVSDSIRVYRYMSTEQAIEYSYKNCYRVMQEREAKLVEALKFYADKNNWNDGLHNKVFDIITVSDLSGYNHNGENYIRGGRRAREALKELGIE